MKTLFRYISEQGFLRLFQRKAVVWITQGQHLDNADQVTMPYAMFLKTEMKKLMDDSFAQCRVYFAFFTASIAAS